MSGLSTPSDISSRSRQGPHANSQLQGISSFPKYVETARPDSSRPGSTGNDTSRLHRSIEMAREQDGWNEQSPLLDARRSGDIEPLPPLDDVLSPIEGDRNEWTPDKHEEARQETKSSWYLLLLTLSIGGCVNPTNITSKSTHHTDTD